MLHPVWGDLTSSSFNSFSFIILTPSHFLSLPITFSIITNNLFITVLHLIQFLKLLPRLLWYLVSWDWWDLYPLMNRISDSHIKWYTTQNPRYVDHTLSSQTQKGIWYPHGVRIKTKKDERIEGVVRKIDPKLYRKYTRFSWTHRKNSSGDCKGRTMETWTDNDHTSRSTPRNDGYWTRWKSYPYVYLETFGFPKTYQVSN